MLSYIPFYGIDTHFLLVCLCEPTNVLDSIVVDVELCM